MKIEICDICKKIPILPEIGMKQVIMIRFEADKDWLGRPKEVRTVCEDCLDKIFK